MYTTSATWRPQSSLTTEGLLQSMQRALKEIGPPPTQSFPSAVPRTIYGGMPVYENPHLTERVGDWIDVIPISRHRSKRIFKKLRQRRQRRSRPMMEPYAVIAGGTLFAHPRVINAMRRVAAERGS